MRSPSRPIVINGKWLAQESTGTQRYATEVVSRLSETLHEKSVLYVPRDATLPSWSSDWCVRRSRFRGAMFEQIALPLRSLGKVAVSLAGSSPLLKRKQAVVLFDASVFRFPETFSRPFVLWYRLLYRTARWRAQRIFTISEFSRTELCSLLNIPEVDLIVAPCGADHFPLLPPGTPGPGGGPRVVVVGSLTLRKNLAAVVAAMAAAGIEVQVVGVSGTGRVFGDTSFDDWHPSLVTLLGRISDETLVEHLRDATALVFPSRYEGFGLPIVEAQRCGCAVVAASTSSLPEVAGAGGRFFDADDSQAAIQHVLELYNNPDARAHLVALGYRNVQRFVWQSTADTIGESIESLAKAARRTRGR